MSDLLLLALISLLLAALLASVLGLAVYSGLGAEVAIRTGSPPVKSITVAYKFRRGPYKECGALFTESCSIGPRLRSIGVFYDDPKQVPAEKCRYIVGSILSEGEEMPSDELVRLYEKFGFKMFSFPEVTHVVMTAFPFRTFLSLYLAIRRVYPALEGYIKERKLCAHPFLEIYQGELIYYVCPLARQDDFYVPEVREAEKQLKDSVDDDRHTDITGNECPGCQGGDSASDTSSFDRDAASDSRGSSLATSVASSMTPLVSYREQEDGDNFSDKSDKGSSDSAASGSSFEELDLEGVDDGKDVVPSDRELVKHKDGPLELKESSAATGEE
ncbi:testis-expressed protein 264 homolog isoform X1 [Polypterus senegalus]|uniref:testis-expressed protein 264 homolog isoform X1 n=1 Tax=Polypterus senegalus TaxID=55291 RepID=UPI0019664959|nr:testis-expressed protein 264 homolog isoform X1 [Polypterus senegalus]